jgi:uncharacterized protein YjlB
MSIRSDTVETEEFTLQPGERIPNNPQLPVLLYRKACTDASESSLREELTANGWPADWTGGIYRFHHYHSTAHEFLAVLEGEATVTLGGPQGTTVALRAGDAVVLPAGTGHCLVDQSADFTVLAAYPSGQSWDLLRAEDPLDDEIRERIENLERPAQDPLLGEEGPLSAAWH